MYERSPHPRLLHWVAVASHLNSTSAPRITLTVTQATGPNPLPPPREPEARRLSTAASPTISTMTIRRRVTNGS